MKRTSIFAASLMCSVMLCAQTTETAVLFSGTDLDDSYLLTDNVSVNFDNGTGSIKVGGETKGTLDLDKGNVTIEFKDAFKLTANQDPKNEANYYSTFFTNKGAYKLPKDKSVTAYAGTVEGKQLKMTNIGETIHKEEPVILRASKSDIILMPSCNKAYLTLASGAKAFVFDFDDGTTTGITSYDNDNDNLYNVNGIRVGSNYKGIVIKNGKKIYQK